MLIFCCTSFNNFILSVNLHDCTIAIIVTFSMYPFIKGEVINNDKICCENQRHSF